MLKEGEVRIPSGCAIAAMISTEGRLITGERITQCMIPMHDRSNGLGGGAQPTEFTPSTKNFMHFMFSLIVTTQDWSVKNF